MTLLLTACAALLLAACQAPAALTPPVSDPSAPPEPTAPAADPTPASKTGEFSFDVSGAAQGWTGELAAAVPPGPDRMGWEAMPQHHRAALQGYPVTAHRMQPQIFVYPVDELAAFNPAAAQAAADLQNLLISRTPPAGALPQLPLSNDIQALHARVVFLDFQNGSGAAYLTQSNQGPVKINNASLIYTFQGLTADGKFYVAAVLPVTHPNLPAAEQVYSDDPAILAGFQAYLADTAAWLEQQPPASFTPSLSVLDDLIRSIRVE